MEPKPKRCKCSRLLAWNVIECSNCGNEFDVTEIRKQARRIVRVPGWVREETLDDFLERKPVEVIEEEDPLEVESVIEEPYCEKLKPAVCPKCGRTKRLRCFPTMPVTYQCPGCKVVWDYETGVREVTDVQCEIDSHAESKSK